MPKTKSLVMEIDGWHIWENTQNRILATGPGYHLLDFEDIDAAVNWFFQRDFKTVERNLHHEYQKLVKETT